VNVTLKGARSAPSSICLYICEYLFGGVCESLPESFKQRAHDTLYGVHHEVPVGAAITTDRGYGTLADRAAADAVGTMATARKKYFGAASGPAYGKQ
jgi:hypothetical protein